MVSVVKHRLAPELALLAIVLLAASIYWPGLNGPFVFDDNHNILGNELVRMDRLELAQVLDAAYSSGGSIPDRSLARVSFALNYYFAGGRFDASAFKLVNIVIHLFNAVLVFALAKVLFAQQAGHAGGARAKWLALFVAGVWVLHPLQLTSVLYVVQRMTSLSALFLFAGLLVYSLGRARVQSGARHGFAMMAVGIVGGTLLGLLCKEIAALMPFLAYVVHLAFFPSATLDVRTRRRLGALHLLLVGSAAIIAVAGVSWNWSGIALAYEQGRDFTMGERLLTQPRVLALYLSLFFFPSLRNLSLHHDELVTSTGLLSPMSTLVALVVLALVAALAVYRLRTGAVWAFAVVFFLVGHLMESSLLALEMVHEHRNYLPSFALAMLLASALSRLTRAASRPVMMAAVLGTSVLAGISVVTWARVGVWSDQLRLAEYMVEQHPDSYRSLSLLAAVQAQRQANVQELFSTYRKIAHINPTAVFPLIRMRRIVGAMSFHLRKGSFAGAPAPHDVLRAPRWDPEKLYLNGRHLEQLAAALDVEVHRRLALAPVNSETRNEFEAVRQCIEDRLDMCDGLVDEALGWMRGALQTSTMNNAMRAKVLGVAAQLEAVTGDFDAALEMLRQAQAYIPDEPFVVMRQALLLGRQGRFEEADALLRRIDAQLSYSRIERRGVEQTKARLEHMRKAKSQSEVKSFSDPRSVRDS